MKKRGPYKVVSIRQKLLLWLLAPVSILFIITTAFTYYVAINICTDAFDESMTDSVKILASHITSNGNQFKLNLSANAKKILESDSTDSFYYKILSPQGKVISANANLQLPSLSNEQRLTFFDGEFDHQKIRTAILRIPVAFEHKNSQFKENHLNDLLEENIKENLSPADPALSQFITVQVAETVRGRSEMATEIIELIVFPQMLIISIAGLVIWYGIQRGLMPLEKIRNALTNRSAFELEALDILSTPKEVRPLVLTLNDLLRRLSEELNRQKRFVGNAAHQIRTPLAGLKVLVDLAVRDNKNPEMAEPLQQIQESVNRSVHLAQRLLSLARSEPGSLNPQDLRPVKLTDLVCETTRELVPLALKHGIDLGYDGLVAFDSGETHWVNGNPYQLKDLLTNLIENAILYTASGGQVTTRVETETNFLGMNFISLVVEDNGPGIPETERQFVFERFYRVLGTKVEGCGLGLAIVKEITDSHQAEIVIQSGKNNQGTLIRVTFDAITSDDFPLPTSSQIMAKENAIETKVPIAFS